MKDDLDIYHIPLPEEPVTEDTVREIVSSMQRTQTGGNIIAQGYLQSANYVPNSTGLQITPTGGSINSGFSISVTTLDVAALGWSQSCAFSITDADTIAWGAGTFTAASGTAYSIGAGNTGNMVAKTYIYLDTAVSTIAYQTTTTSTTAVGAGKVLIAVAQNATGEATYTVLAGQGGQNIDASAIVANSITANELSTSITYAGSIIVDTAGLIRSGQTAYDTGTGFFIGNVAGTPKLSIGVGGSTSASMTWDGTTLKVNGSAILNNHIFGDASDGVVTISVNTTLARDMFYDTLTINTTKIVDTAGFRIFVQNTLTNNGTIRNNGAAAAGGTAGAGAAAGSCGAGGTGASISGSGGTTSRSPGGNGGNGGAGSGGGIATPPTAAQGGYRYIPQAINGYTINNLIMQGGGGGDWGNSGGADGAGGGGAGVIIIAARIFVNTSGIIQANGGAGGNAPGPGSFNGGGGGGGGFISLVYTSFSAGTEQASGGAKGLKIGAGADGFAGSSGTVLKLQV